MITWRQKVIHMEDSNKNTSCARLKWTLRQSLASLIHHCGTMCSKKTHSPSRQFPCLPTPSDDMPGAVNMKLALLHLPQLGVSLNWPRNKPSRPCMAYFDGKERFTISPLITGKHSILRFGEVKGTFPDAAVFLCF